MKYEDTFMRLRIDVREILPDAVRILNPGDVIIYCVHYT